MSSSVMPRMRSKAAGLGARHPSWARSSEYVSSLTWTPKGLRPAWQHHAHDRRPGCVGVLGAGVVAHGSLRRREPAGSIEQGKAYAAMLMAGAIARVLPPKPLQRRRKYRRAIAAPQPRLVSLTHVLCGHGIPATWRRSAGEPTGRPDARCAAVRLLSCGPSMRRPDGARRAGRSWRQLAMTPSA